MKTQMLRYVVFVAALLSVLTGWRSSAWGQAVQLPTFHYFTVQTTVSVPDRGAVTLGGVSRAADFSQSSGVPLLGRVPFANRLFQNRSLSSERSWSGVQATATIIDHQAWDEAVLAGADDLVRRDWMRERAAFLSRHVSRNPVPRGAPAYAAADEVSRAMMAGDGIPPAAERQEEEAAGYLQRARHLEQQGQPGAAAVYYRLAARGGTEPIRAEALARLDAVTPRAARGSPAGP